MRAEPRDASSWKAAMSGNTMARNGVVALWAGRAWGMSGILLFIIWRALVFMDAWFWLRWAIEKVEDAHDMYLEMGDIRRHIHELWERGAFELPLLGVSVVGLLIFVCVGPWVNSGVVDATRVASSQRCGERRDGRACGRLERGRGQRRAAQHDLCAVRGGLQAAQGGPDGTGAGPSPWVDERHRPRVRGDLGFRGDESCGDADPRRQRDRMISRLRDPDLPKVFCLKRTFNKSFLTVFSPSQRTFKKSFWKGFFILRNTCFEIACGHIYIYIRFQVWLACRITSYG